MPQGRCPVIAQALRVPMRDGVKLSVHVHRPDTSEKVPALMSYTPYRLGRLVPGGHHPIVEAGYATVDFDIRGTGNSEGWNDSIYSDPERQDGYDMVEWVAAQPWCNGHVGMWGISFGAVVALQMAGAAPPHLKAIIARSGSDDPYTEWTNPGGSPRPYMMMTYAPIMTAANFSPPDPVEVGSDWWRIWTERLEHNVPWGLAFAENMLDGPFWRDRSLRGKYDRVRCAVYVVDGWADWYHHPLLRIFANLPGARKALIGPWSHEWPDVAVPGPRIDWLHEARRWFDYWLKGVETGVMDEPPVTLFVREYSRPATLVVRDRGEFRSETEWPPARTQPTWQYFGAAGSLSPSAPAEPQPDLGDKLHYDPRVGTCTGLHGGGPFNNNWAMPLDQRPDELLSLVYTSQPLEEDLEVIGVPVAVLWFAAPVPVLLFAVKLCDVAPDGTSALVTKGFLNVCHRDSHTQPTPISPGEPTRVEVELLSCAYRFARGHRLRAVVAHADFMNVWPTPLAFSSTVFRNAARPSGLILPVVSRREPPLPPPALKPSPHPDATREQLEAPQYRITRDLIQDTVAMEYRTTFGPHWDNHGSITVSAAEPWNTVVRGDSTYVHHIEGRTILVEAHCTTWSDKQALHHTTRLEVTLDGRPHFSRSWGTSVPRECF